MWKHNETRGSVSETTDVSSPLTLVSSSPRSTSPLLPPLDQPASIPWWKKLWTGFLILLAFSLIYIGVRTLTRLRHSSATASSTTLLTVSASEQLSQILRHVFQAPVVEVVAVSNDPRQQYMRLQGWFTPPASNGSVREGMFNYTLSADSHHYHVLVSYDKGYEWITEGDDGQKEELFVDGTCLLPHHVPPLHTMERQWLQSAVSGPNHTFQVVFEGEPYVIQPIHDGVIRVQNRLLTLHLSASDEIHATPSPLPDLSICPVLFTSTESLTFSSLPSTALSLEAITDECACHERTNCLFIHGIGVKEDVGVTNEFTDYWGSLRSLLPCCSVVKYTHFNTEGVTWFNPLLVQRLCDAMDSVASNHSFILRNTTDDEPVKHIHNLSVIAHSTGNLHVAAAMLYNTCQLDASSSKWIAIQGPMKGTNTANRVMEECAVPVEQQSKLVQRVFREFDLCPPKASTKSLALKDTNASATCLNTLYTKAAFVYKTHVNASLCGVSPYGLTSTSSAKFKALAAFSNHSSKNNDGVVEFNSCAVPNVTYGSNYRSRFYKAAINHDDGRLVHGDGVWGSNRQPIRWVQCQLAA